MLVKKGKTFSKEKILAPKTPRQIERHLKGVANHRRIEMLFLIAEHRGISVDGISKSLRCNIKTISGHLLKLEHSGLIRKRNVGRAVIHELSPYGTIIVKFLKTFSHS